MKLNELIVAAKDTLTVRRVYGEPYERDGLTIIPVATITGGGGGGEGHDNDGQGGGGFGMTAKPVGMYVIKGGEVTWRPAVDVNRLMVSAVALTAIIAVARMRLTSLRTRRQPR